MDKKFIIELLKIENVEQVSVVYKSCDGRVVPDITVKKKLLPVVCPICKGTIINHR